MSALDVCVGSTGQESMHIRHVGTLEVAAREGQVLTGRVPEGWKLAAVCTKGTQGMSRMFLLEPSDDSVTLLRIGPKLYVRGNFRIALKVNDSRMAAETFKAFEPE